MTNETKKQLQQVSADYVQSQLRVMTSTTPKKAAIDRAVKKVHAVFVELERSKALKKG